MPNKQYIRQSGIINIEGFRDNEITIVGCGAVGSFVAVSLAKMGLTKFKLYDHDTVEEHNLPNQFFNINDIGFEKTQATKNAMRRFNSDCEIEVYKKWIEQPLITPIILSCADSMSVRKELFQQAKKSKKVEFFIDTRMGGLQGQVYSIDMKNKKDIKFYEDSLFSKSEAVQIACTERSIIFTVLGIASLVCNQIIKAFKEEKVINYIVLDYSVPQMM